MSNQQGHLHPITQLLDTALAIFTKMGFSVVLGPEVDTEYYNFDALNIPAHHPARDMQDTFWLKPRTSGMLPRTHVSGIQVRHMEKNQPPIKVVYPIHL
jgi:phenylalanyl-tRNA synthetase alpha chain